MMRLALDWKKAWDVFFLDAVQRRIIILVQVALVLMLAATLAQLTWKVIPLPARSLAPPPQALRGAAAPGDQSGGGVLWDLAKWHLFGEKPVGSASPAVESLPETQLNLTLSGVVAAGGATGGGAIIAAPGGSEAFYTINAQLPGGAILKEVYPDRVVLERNGRLETLRLPKEGLGNLNGAAQAGDTSGLAGNPVPLLPEGRGQRARRLRPTCANFATASWPTLRAPAIWSRSTRRAPTGASSVMSCSPAGTPACSRAPACLPETSSPASTG